MRSQNLNLKSGLDRPDGEKSKGRALLNFFTLFSVVKSLICKKALIDWVRYRLGWFGLGWVGGGAGRNGHRIGLKGRVDKISYSVNELG